MHKQILKSELYSVLRKKDFNVSDLEHVINQYKNRFRTDTEIILNNVIDAAAESCGTSKELMFKKRRTKEVVMARFLVFWFYKYNSLLSLSAIGRIFNRDHSTVLNGLKVLRNDFDTNYMPTIEKFESFKDILIRKEIDVNF